MSDLSQAKHFFDHNGASVYHAPQYNQLEVILSHHYTLSRSSPAEFEFDVRDLPLPKNCDPVDHQIIIRNALDQGIIPLPQKEASDKIKPTLTSLVKMQTLKLSRVFSI